MNRDDERLIWIVAILLVLWFVFRRAGFSVSAGVGPVGASFGFGTRDFLSGGGCGCQDDCRFPTGPVTGDFGNYAQG